jgi:hypothetical protein
MARTSNLMIWLNGRARYIVAVILCNFQYHHDYKLLSVTCSGANESAYSFKGLKEALPCTSNGCFILKLSTTAELLSLSLSQVELSKVQGEQLLLPHDSSLKLSLTGHHMTHDPSSHSNC